MSWWRGVLSFVVAGSVVLGARRAEACGACTCARSDDAIVLLGSSVPLNLQVPLLLSVTEQVTLLELPAGHAVPFTVTRTPGATGLSLLKVDQDLVANTDYALLIGADGSVPFRTGSARDEGQPTFAGATVVSGQNAGLCGTSIGGRLMVEGVTDEPTSTLWLEVEVEVEGARQTRFAALPPQAIGLPLGQSSLGCFGSAELGGLAAGASYPTRVRVHDLGGNASQWYELAFEPTAEEPGGCGPTPSGGAGAANGAAGAGSSAGVPSAGDPNAPSAGDRTSSSCSFASSPNRAPFAFSIPLLLVGLRRLRRQK